MLGESLLAAALLLGAAVGVNAALGSPATPGEAAVTVDLADGTTDGAMDGATGGATDGSHGGASRSAAADLVGAVGAGIYEELLFRLTLLPLAYGLFRMLRCGPRGAAALAVVSSSLLFALCHHLGPHGEIPAVGPFLFRAVAGGVLAGLFWWRGFGIAVGAHAAYDLLAGVLLAG